MIEHEYEQDKLLGEAAQRAAKEAIKATFGDREMGAQRIFGIFVYVIDNLIVTAAEIYKTGHPHKSTDDCIAETMGYAMHFLGIETLSAVAGEEPETMQ